MGSAARRGLAFLALVASACPVGPRRVPGDKAPAPAAKTALELLAEPDAPRIVAAERTDKGSRLVLIDERGATIRPLTDEPVDGSIDVTPAWSPDGGWILFASSRGHEATSELSLWIVPVFAEGGARRLTEGPAVDMTPAWSHDGRRIAWASTRGGAGFDIWMADFAAGDGPPKLTKPRRVTRHEDEDTMPAARWELLAWVRHHDGKPSLIMWHEDHDEEEAMPDLFWPAFSPDSSQLAAVFRSQRGDSDLLIGSIRPKGGPPRKLDSSLGDESGPRFTADDRFLFATSVARTEKAQALWSSIVFVDLTEDPLKLRALYDKDPLPRLGVDVAPVPLDAEVLLQAPEYREGLKRVLGAFGLEPG